jgi:hypothetical protein
MSTSAQLARISLVPGGMAGTCELCNAEAFAPTTTIIVRQPAGGIAQVSACDWCAHAIRRLATLTAGAATFEMAGDVEPPQSSRPAAASRGRAVGSPSLIVQFPEHIRDATGHCVVRVAGCEDADGTWEGWLEFVAG